MTREGFINVVKANGRKRAVLGSLFLVLLGGFGFAEVVVVKHWDDQAVPPSPLQLWCLVGLTAVFGVALVAVLLANHKCFPHCPHCRQTLGITSARVAVASGRCGLCGEQIIEEH